ALRRLEHARGRLESLEHRPADAAPVDEVIAEAFANLTNGPTWFVGDSMRTAAQLLGSMSRNDAVRMIQQATAAAMGEG
ncbi:MAG: short-chain dehydrogenase, partial [Actinomycetota bacterium]|nr:short-chain dehydrogenase [Actinomycetota bacterium]